MIQGGNASAARVMTLFSKNIPVLENSPAFLQSSVCLKKYDRIPEMGLRYYGTSAMALTH